MDDKITTEHIVRTKLHRPPVSPNFIRRPHLLERLGNYRQSPFTLVSAPAGYGKSTLARLWNRQKDVTVLSDDRTIVRKKDGHYWMYGTPWHGEAKFGVPRGVKLEKIFFLRHASRNAIHEVAGAPSVTQLLQCSFPPYWDAAGMEFAMQFFSDLAAAVSCQMLAFTPDRRLIKFIRAMR